MASRNEVASLDFSQPWKLSDLVLVVEKERFHVHRAILAFWSPVFEKMFTSEFQEKDANEVPLPGKKASEIKEMLLLIYPSVTEREITEENGYFLLKLAHEYQMEAIVKRCGDFMAENVNVKRKESVLANLVFAQTYELEKLRLASVNQAYCFSLDDLKQELFDQIEADNLREITEGIVKRLQRESRERQQKINEMRVSIQSVKTKCLSEVGRIAEARLRRNKTILILAALTQQAILLLYRRIPKHTIARARVSPAVCYGLSVVSPYLSSIKQQLGQFLPS